MDAGRRHETPGSETKDFIIQGMAGSMHFMSGLAHPYLARVWWLCDVSICLGWTVSQNYLSWVGELQGQREVAAILWLTRLSWSSSPCWCEAAGIPPSLGSSSGFSDSWTRFMCSLMRWRAQFLQDIFVTRIRSNKKKQLSPNRWLSNHYAT